MGLVVPISIYGRTGPVKVVVDATDPNTGDPIDVTGGVAVADVDRENGSRVTGWDIVPVPGQLHQLSLTLPEAKLVLLRAEEGDLEYDCRVTLQGVTTYPIERSRIYTTEAVTE